jgi:hypothetical protein
MPKGLNQRFKLTFVIILSVSLVIWFPNFGFGKTYTTSTKNLINQPTPLSSTTSEYTYFSIKKIGSWVTIGLEAKVKFGNKLYTNQSLTYDWIISADKIIRMKTIKPFARIQIQPGIKNVVGQVSLIPKNLYPTSVIKTVPFSLVVPQPRLNIIVSTPTPGLTLPAANKLVRGQELELIPSDFSSFDLDYNWSKDNMVLSTNKKLVIDDSINDGDVIIATVKNRRNPTETATTKLTIQLK